MPLRNNSTSDARKTLLRRGLVFITACAVCLLVGVIIHQETTKTAHQTDIPQTPPPAAVPSVQVTPSSKQVAGAIDRAASYLSQQVLPTGRFRYRVHLQGRTYDQDKYNVLRHAGSLYALGEFCLRSPDNQEIRDAALRATRYLQKRHIRPVPQHEDLLAAWSLPQDQEGHGTPPRPQAKLGGTGISLVGLMTIEKVQPGTTPLPTLRKLARFILFMQHEDGHFDSKLFSDGTRDKQWTSLYYPGEAMLGLMLLYDKDPDPQWLEAAARGMAYLARTRKTRADMLPDHWALLATKPLLRHYGKLEKPPIARESLEKHAANICQFILEEQNLSANNPMSHGAFDTDGRTTPAATRLEGLQAAFTYLPQPYGTQKLRHGIMQGIGFLLRAQIRHASHTGAFTRATQYKLDLPAHKKFNRRVEEVRIDYVQHALSALMQYEQIIYQ